MNKNLDLSNIELFPDGSIRAGFPQDEYHFETEYGKLKAQHTNSEARKPTINSLEFFDSGQLRKISLEEQTKVLTSYGELPAELILFYESKDIRKIFPLNGRITGYWSEKDEYGLAKELEFNIANQTIKGKFINIEFYPSQAVKSLLLWPNETIVLDIFGKKVKVKNKISFYENGNIKSIDPASSVLMDTPIGEINIIDTNSSGFGFKSTINFKENGDIAELQTSSDKFEVVSESQEVTEIMPKFLPSMCNDKILIPQPIKVRFEDECVYFDDTQYEIAPNRFLIYNNTVKVSNISCCG